MNKKMESEFEKITKEIIEKHPNKRMMIVIEPDTNGIDKYVTAYESHKFKNGTGYYLGAELEQVKISREICCEICKQSLTSEEIKTGHCFNCGEQEL
jgi:uncharacterized CHY-type Zn-finger protein